MTARAKKNNFCCTLWKCSIALFAQKDHQHLGCFLLLLLVTKNPNPGARISKLQGMTAAAPPANWSTKSATHPIHKTPKWSPPPPSSFLSLKLQRHAHSEPYFNFTNACILTTKCTPRGCRQSLWELTELERNPTAKSNKLTTFFKHSFPFLPSQRERKKPKQSLLQARDLTLNPSSSLSLFLLAHRVQV